MYVSHLNWNSTYYFDVYIKVSNQWRYHRRVNTYNGVEHQGSNHSGNNYLLVAVGLDRGVSQVKIQQRSGRIHLSGVMFSSQNNGFSDSGFIHADNICLLYTSPSPRDS